MRDLNRHYTLGVRVNEVEHERMTKAAATVGMKLAPWMRHILTREVKLQASVSERIATLEQRVSELERALSRPEVA